MMGRCGWVAITAGLVLGVLPAFGQYTTVVTDFEAAFYPPGDGLAEVVFREPAFSGSSLGLNPAIGSDAYLCSLTTCGSFIVPNSGQQADLVYWGWLQASYHTSWVRLSTSGAQWIPNPALHLGGKVRFWAGGTAYTDGTFGTEVLTGKLLLGIGVRETGAGAPLGTDGGSSGSIEWVGLTQKLAEITAGANGTCDTTATGDDVQVRAPGTAAGPDDVCVAVGTNGAIDTTPASDDVTMVTPIGTYSLLLDRTMRQYTFDLPALQASGNVFSFLGDGVLLATPNNRGTLEHLALTNDPNNGAVNANVIVLWIDDIEFEAPIPSPPTMVTLPNPPLPLDTVVNLANVEPAADPLELYIKGRGGDPDFLLGSVSNPGGTTYALTTSIPLPFGVEIYARQKVGAVFSDYSTPYKVSAPGNGPVRLSMAVRETDQYDHDLACGDNGTGYDPDAPAVLEFIGATGMVEGAWGTPVGGTRYSPAFVWQNVTFDPCIDPVAAFSEPGGNGLIATNGVPYTNGVWEGIYFRIDEFLPTAGPYTVYIDDMKVLSGGADYCLIDDFESYTVANYVVENAVGTAATAATGDDVQVTAVGAATFVGQIIVGPGGNGVLDTTPTGGEYVSALHARFDTPGVAGTSQGVAATPVLSAVTAEEAFSGAKSLKLRWAFVNATNPNSHLRLTSNGSFLANAPETFMNPDPVIPFTFDGTLCDGSNDIAYSFMMLIEPSPVMGDCDLDGDVDLADAACFQQCYGTTPLSPACDELFDYYKDNGLNPTDYQMFQLSITGPL